MGVNPARWWPRVGEFQKRGFAPGDVDRRAIVSQYSDGESLCEGVGSRGSYAMIGGDTHDVDVRNLPCPQPVRERCAVSRALESRVGRSVLALAEVGLRRADRLMHGGTEGLGHAVHRPRIDKVRVLREVRARVNVPILGGNDGIVTRLESTDAICYLGALVSSKGTAGTEIVLDVNDDKCGLHTA